MDFVNDVSPDFKAILVANGFWEDTDRGLFIKKLYNGKNMYLEIRDCWSNKFKKLVFSYVVSNIFREGFDIERYYQVANDINYLFPNVKAIVQAHDDLRCEYVAIVCKPNEIEAEIRVAYVVLQEAIRYCYAICPGVPYHLPESADEQIKNAT